MVLTVQHNIDETQLDGTPDVRWTMHKRIHKLHSYSFSWPMIAFDRLQVVPLPSGSTFKVLMVLFSITAENLQKNVS